MVPLFFFRARERRREQRELEAVKAWLRQYLYEHGDWYKDEYDDIRVRIELPCGEAILFVEELTD